MKPLSTGLSSKSCTPRLTLTERQLSFSNRGLFRLGSLKTGLLNDNQEGNKCSEGPISVRIPKSKLPCAMRYRRSQKHLREIPCSSRRLTLKKHSERSIDSLQRAQDEIYAIIKESEDMKEEIFNSIPRDPKPSFKVSRRHKEYKKIWDPFTSFYKRNNQ